MSFWEETVTSMTWTSASFDLYYWTVFTSVEMMWHSTSFQLRSVLSESWSSVSKSLDQSAEVLLAADMIVGVSLNRDCSVSRISVPVWSETVWKVSIYLGTRVVASVTVSILLRKSNLGGMLWCLVIGVRPFESHLHTRTVWGITVWNKQ